MIIDITNNEICCDGITVIEFNTPTNGLAPSVVNREAVIDIIRRWTDANRYRDSDGDVAIASKFVLDSSEIPSRSDLMSMADFIDVMVRTLSDATAYRLSHG
jgi:hypothetical protein